MCVCVCVWKMCCLWTLCACKGTCKHLTDMKHTHHTHTHMYYTHLHMLTTHTYITPNNNHRDILHTHRRSGLLRIPRRSEINSMTCAQLKPSWRTGQTLLASRWFDNDRRLLVVLSCMCVCVSVYDDSVVNYCGCVLSVSFLCVCDVAWHVGVIHMCCVPFSLQ